MEQNDEKQATGQQAWHSLQVAEVIEQTGSDSEKGLSASDAEQRLALHGKNILPEKKKKNKLIGFLKHFHDILIYVLFAAAIITFFIGEYKETIVILIVAVVNASIGFFQENKAEKALADIKKMLSLKAQVIRYGQRMEIDAADLVIGDIVTLAPGAKVPADLRLVQTDNLRIEESPLTGESLPVEKSTTPLPAGTMLGDRVNMAFSGTTVSAGTGTGVVIATGEQTELGKINQMMSEVKQLTTPLLKQTAQFGKAVSIAILAGSVLIFLFGYFFRRDLYEPSVLLLSVIGLAIAAIPEGLPAILSIILAIGVQNMARRNAIVRTLPSVETLGSVSVICSDKTGTLTKNEMTVQTLDTRSGEFDVTGTGYAPQGEILLKEQKVDFAKDNVLKELVMGFRICNDASIAQDEDGQWKVNGAPTEGALVTLFHKADIDHTPTPRLSTIPFDSEYKYMATLIERGDNNLIYIKGAPDRLLEMATSEICSGEEVCSGEKRPIDKAYWEERISGLALRGQRIIGAAYKIVDKSVKTISHEDIRDGIVLLGLAGIIDPPRDEAIEAVRKCKEAGTTVKMITGDHIDTARTIARQLGIGNGEDALQGKDLEEMSDEQMQEAVMKYDVFARTSPEHKLRLVTALQAKEVICAMTGDGVNDAPSLRKADVGVAMGIKGTEVTKDAAEMVLADDNFATIVAAVEEGRRVYDNLKKTILFVLPTNGAESLLIIASILFGTMLPLSPVQILWVNMVTSVTISLALAFEKLEPWAMKRPPRSPKTPLLSRYFIWRIFFVSAIIAGFTLLITMRLKNYYGFSEDFVRTITLQTIVIAQMFHLFNSRTVRGNAFKENFFSNRAVIVVCLLLFVLQGGITYLPFMNSAFGTVPLSLSDWKFPFLAGIAVFLIVEVEKAIMRRIDKAAGREHPEGI